MTTMRCALILILATLSPATAQDADPVDIVVEAATLRDGATGEGSPFAAGAGIDVAVTWRNDGEEAVSLRRIVLNADPVLTILDPASDTLDNDGDGETDEDDEAFRRHGGGDGAAWRFADGGLRLDPGDTLTRTLRVVTAKTAPPGITATLGLSAGSTLSEGKRSRPQKTLHTFDIALVPATLSLESSDGVDISVLSEPVMTGEVVLPGAILGDARVGMAFSTAITGGAVRRYRVGTAIDCDEDPAPAVEDGRSILRLGRCTVDGAQPARDRTVQVSVPLTVTDAAPGVTGDALAEWRALGVTLTASDGDAEIGREILDMQLRGPRIATRLTLPPGRRYRAGDTVVARLGIANTGNLPLAVSTVTVLNTETFRCISATFGGEETARDCDGQAIALPSLDAGETLDVALTMQLRKDALFETGTGPRLELTGDTVAAHPFPVVPIAMALHVAPAVEVTEARDFEEVNTGFAATIGEGARLRISGSLPPGRYRGEVRLMARALAFRTGIPLSPATLLVTDPDLAISSAEGRKIGTNPEYSEKEGPLWSEHVLAFDLRGDTVDADRKRSFTADFDIAIADDPRLTAGRVVELTAETVAYGDSTMTGNTWIAVLVEEPDLRLKLLSLDDDRTVEPDERFGVVALACNYGDSAAHGAILTLDTSPRIDLLSEETVARVFTVPLDAAREGQLDEIDENREALEGVEARVYERSVTLVRGDAPVAPEECIGVELTAPLTPDPAGTDTTASVLAALDAYAGAAESSSARRYDAIRTPPMRFQARSVRLGPSTTIQLGNDATISHPVELSVPEGLGPFSVSLETLSSTGLDWSLLTMGGGGDLRPWVDGRKYADGSKIVIRMRTTTPERLPLGWVDTSRLRATILTEDGRRLDAALRLVIRAGTGSARAIDTEKRVALDRDCDGDLTDERAQDALFEPGKDARPGDCFVVRIGFENTGQREVEKIVIRDALSSRTTLLSDSASVRIAPEPLDDVILPRPESGILEWEFRGLFRPGAVGEVEYRLRLDPL